MPTTFDGDNLTITLAAGDVEMDAADDLYEPWKEWVRLSDNSKYPAAFRVTGGDPLTPGITAGAYFFLRNDNGWRIRPAEEDATILAIGNLAPEDSTLPIMIPTIGDFTVLIAGLQPITQNVAEILTSQQDGEYGGKVTLNTLIGTAGTAYPVGTPQEPVSNMPDAMVIAARLGIQRMDITGSTSIGLDMSSWEMVGLTANAHIDVGGQNVTGSLFRGLHVTGAFGAATAPVILENCVVDAAGVTNFEGEMINCWIRGDIEIGGETHIVDSSSIVAGAATPTLDMNGLATDVSVRAYSGGLEVINCTSAVSNASIDLLSGSLTLAASCTDGVVVVRGVGEMTDNSAGMTVFSTGMISQTTIGDAVHHRDLDADTVLIGGGDELAGNKISKAAKFAKNAFASVWAKS